MQGRRFRLGLSRMLSAEGKEGAARCNAGVDDAARCVRDVASGSTMEECLLMRASMSFRSTRYESSCCWVQSSVPMAHVPAGDGDAQLELEPRLQMRAAATAVERSAWDHSIAAARPGRRVRGAGGERGRWEGGEGMEKHKHLAEHSAERAKS